MGVIGSFGCAWRRPDSYGLRALCALLHTCFSMGCAFALEWGHGQYVVLWSAWGMLLPAWWAVAVCRGSVAYLYVCAGVAKVCVPSRRDEYVEASTMRALLSKDGAEPRFNPSWKALARRIISSDARGLGVHSKVTLP